MIIKKKNARVAVSQALIELIPRPLRQLTPMWVVTCGAVTFKFSTITPERGGVSRVKVYEEIEMS